jgi:Rrf2 family protein
MLISRKYDYAIRIIRTLAGGEKLTIAEICKKEHIPISFGYKIAKELKRGFMIKGYCGSNGGYQLNMPLVSISLFDIYAAVEGALYINECLKECAECPNNEGGQMCAVHKLLGGVQDKIVDMLKQSNMADVLNNV